MSNQCNASTMTDTHANLSEPIDLDLKRSFRAPSAEVMRWWWWWWCWSFSFLSLLLILALLPIAWLQTQYLINLHIVLNCGMEKAMTPNDDDVFNAMYFPYVCEHLT